VGNQSGDVYSLGHDGQVLSRFQLPDGVKCLVADDFWIYAGCDDGSVYDLSGRTQLFSLRAGVRRPPASVEKLYTTVALLRRLGPGARLHTIVLGTGPATATFTIAADCASMPVSLGVYLTHGAGFSLPQTRSGTVSSGMFGPGSHTLSVAIPACFFQVDLMGTATPPSNDATLASYPQVGGGNPSPSAPALWRLAPIAARGNPRVAVDLPTAIGSVMSLRRRCLYNVVPLR